MNMKHGSRPPEAPSYLYPEKTPQITLKSAIDYPYKAGSLLTPLKF
jgi:hypothetical protein